MRIKLIQKLVHINESIFFYPKLKKFYQSYFDKESLRIIDIGANKGQSIDFFLTVNPKAKIDSFEPIKNYSNYFKSNSSKSQIFSFTMSV